MRRRYWGAAAVAVIALVTVTVVVIQRDPSPEHVAYADAEPVYRKGQIVVECGYSHSDTVDPIVFPGETDKSHLHDFFGSTITAADTTIADLTDGDTTCEIGEDRAAYWAPALFDGDTKIEPASSDAYYRAPPGVEPEDVGTIPEGLVMIGGNQVAEAVQPPAHVGWTCSGNGRRTAEPHPCKQATTLEVTFPDCWDGKNLDSEDHMSHMARSGPEGCPGSHPEPIPQLEFIVWYRFTGNPVDLRLASGDVLTGHADFMNGWDPDRLSTEVGNCLQRDVVCGVAFDGI